MSTRRHAISPSPSVEVPARARFLRTGAVALLIGLLSALLPASPAAAASVSPGTFDLSSGCSQSGFPPGPHSIRADFVDTADADDDINVGDFVTYTYRYEPASPLSFNSQWTIDLTIDGAPAQITATIDPFTGGDVGSVMQQMVAGDAGSVITATVDQVQVVNTENNVTVICTPPSNDTISIYVNEPPAPQDDNGETLPGVPVQVPVLANDGTSEDSGASIGAAQSGAGQDDVALTGPPTIVGAAANGTCAPVGDQIEYTPNAGFVGTDSCRYRIADNDGATGEATLNVAVSEFAIDLVKTVGTDPDSCATESTLTGVLAGTTVYYCYTVTNTGAVDIATHDLVDDQLGTLLSGFPLNLSPGASFDTVTAGVTADAVIDNTTVNIAKWTGTTVENDVTTAEATATVTVTVGSEPPGGGGETPTPPGSQLPDTGNGSDIIVWAVFLSSVGGLLVLHTRREPSAG